MNYPLRKSEIRTRTRDRLELRENIFAPDFVKSTMLNLQCWICIVDALKPTVALTLFTKQHQMDAGHKTVS